MFDYAKFQNAAIALVGALVLSTVSVGAAVGPAHVVEKGSVQVAASVQAGQFA